MEKGKRDVRIWQAAAADRRGRASLVVTAAACSSTGGKKAEEAAAGGATAGKADTPEMTIAMITHARARRHLLGHHPKGAEAAAAKDNVDL